MQPDRYRLVERIGQGGMATVWRAEDLVLGREVAVKVLLPFVAERAEGAERFEREARALAGIRHDNVLQLFDYVPADGEQPARLIMELLRGPSLHRFVVDAGAPLPEVAALIGAEVASGLAAVHARGIVHRDVKPENVLLDEGRVILTDFGVARVVLSERSALTQTGAIIGSPTYMSPEQARGDEVDARSDQFSLGSLLYFVATGSAPFSGTHPLVVMQKIERADYTPAGAKNPRVPAWLDRVLRRCLQRDPDDRYADANALCTALKTGLADDGVGAPALELKSYFASPPDYNAGLPTRIVPARLADAERALARGDRSRALASAERVLQLDLGHARATAIIARITKQGRRPYVLGAALGVVAIAAAATLVPRAQPIVETPAPRSIAVAPPRVEAPLALDAAVVEKRKATARPRAHETVVAALVEPTPEPVVVEPLPKTATLAVRTSPWCELAIDGVPRGRTPQSLTLPVGRHALRCENPSGARLERTIELVGGVPLTVEERLVEQVSLAPSLTRGDAVAIDDAAPSASPRRVTPGRRRVTLVSAGASIETRWIDVPRTGCHLVDAPTLHCDGP